MLGNTLLQSTSCQLLPLADPPVCHPEAFRPKRRCRFSVHLSKMHSARGDVQTICRMPRGEDRVWPWPDGTRLLRSEQGWCYGLDRVCAGPAGSCAGSLVPRVVLLTRNL